MKLAAASEACRIGVEQAHISAAAAQLVEEAGREGHGLTINVSLGVRRAVSRG
jgi:hypothetical protein